MKRTGGARTVRGKFYARVRLGGKRRLNVPLIASATEEQATTRAGDVAEVAQMLLDAGRITDVKAFCVRIAAAPTDKDVRVIKLAVAKLVGTAAPITTGETFAQLGAKWTNGDLARSYPDHVRVIDHRHNIGILQKLDALIGPIPLAAFTLDDADRAMAAIDAPAGSAIRRHYAQVIHRILAIAAYPAKVIKISPLPKGWLPKLGPAKAKSYLYPDEERALMRCKDVPLAYRILFGFLGREGCRASEAIALEWSDLDLKRGGLNLDENKTDDPRAWALDAGVVRALRWWKAHGGPASGPFAGLTSRHLADRLREALRSAGVDREALFENSDRRMHMQAHHLRATFVTLSLANGKTETWVQDRTGHKSTLMIAKYRRIARTAAELRIKPLTPLDRALPEAGGSRVGQRTTKTRGKKDAK